MQEAAQEAVAFEFDWSLARDFGTALLLGGLVGLEREKHKTAAGHGAAGIRTFVLFALLGAIGGFLSQHLESPWVLVAVLSAAVALIVASYLAHARVHPDSLGLTTELAAVMTCLVGALVVTGNRELGVGLGVVIAALLAYKQTLHAMVGRLDRDDVLAGMRLLLATFIVLPLLPDEPVDPWGALNPYKLWLLVLLISGLSLVGYAVTRWLGSGRGIAVTAAAGGLASSTAVTLALVRQSTEANAQPRRLAGGVLLAWAIMFGRVVVTATIVAPSMFVAMVVPFGAMLVACGAFAAIYLRARDGAAPAAELHIENPFSLLAACKFALLFAVVQLLVKLGQEYLPQSGVYTIAAVAGLTDVDAITLSMAEQARGGGDMDVAVIAIAIAAASNTLVKAGMAVFMGKGLTKPVLAGTGIVLAVGAVALVFA